MNLKDRQTLHQLLARYGFAALLQTVAEIARDRAYKDPGYVNLAEQIEGMTATLDL